VTSLDSYMLLFRGREDVFAEQQEDGSYRPVLRPLTPEDVYAHVNGRATYGIYTTTPNDTVKFIVFDIDTMDPDPRIRIETALRELGVADHGILEFSGRKGFHIWLPFQSYQPAAVAYRAGRAVLQRAGVLCEVFPKQATVGEGYGNLIKLPLGVHRVSSGKSRLFGRWAQVTPLHVVQLFDLADQYEEPRRTETPAVVSRAGPYGRSALIRACARVAEAPEGQRNNQLNLEAYSLYGLVAGDVLSEDDVEVNLSNAAIAAGLDISETVKTLASAKAAGMARPITPRRL
jgi:TOTE conflict system primase-like protein